MERVTETQERPTPRGSHNEDRVDQLLDIVVERIPVKVRRTIAILIAIGALSGVTVFGLNKLGVKPEDKPKLPEPEPIKNEQPLIDSISEQEEVIPLTPEVRRIIGQKKLDEESVKHFIDNEKKMTKQSEEPIIHDAEATSYCACEVCCGNYAKNRPIDPETGEEIVIGAAKRALVSYNPEHPELISSAAVNPNVIPLGTIFRVYDKKGDLIGTFRADDTGNPKIVKGKIFDVYYGPTSHSEALKFGRKKDLTIEIIELAKKNSLSPEQIANLPTYDYEAEKGDNLWLIAKVEWDKNEKLRDTLESFNNYLSIVKSLNEEKIDIGDIVKVPYM